MSAVAPSSGELAADGRTLRRHTALDRLAELTRQALAAAAGEGLVLTGVTVAVPGLVRGDSGGGDAGLRRPPHYDVQARVDGEWRTVDSVRGNVAGTRTSKFDPVAADAVRIVIDATNDGGYSRLVEVGIPTG